jgi:hypothetical protein
MSIIICAGSAKKARGLWIGEGLPDGDSDDLSEDTSDEEKESKN